MESRPYCYNRTYDICPLRFSFGSAAISARGKNDPSASDGLWEIKTSESPRRILKSRKWNQSITSLMCCFWDSSHFFMWLDWKESFCFEKLYLSRAESEVASSKGSRKRLYDMPRAPRSFDTSWKICTAKSAAVWCRVELDTAVNHRRRVLNEFE